VVILGAAAARTKHIRLTSAVTVLSAADPVRVFQEFATLDLISHGRAEIVAGRGSSIEAFPLFGFDLDDYDSLFAEKLDLLLKIRDNTPGPNGPLIPDIVETFPEAPVVHRPGEINAWDNAEFVSAVKATGRKKLIIAGSRLRYA
jgi:alkanesulfonate monooxygenase SsuD/methylene tetrahydromethanopterin reductase-like flavin-dependent oxidoreductase (luciferase family)